MIEILSKMSQEELLQVFEILYGQEERLKKHSALKSELHKKIKDWLEERYYNVENKRSKGEKELDFWILRRVAKKLKLPTANSMIQLEERIQEKAIKIIGVELEKLSPEKKEKISKEIEKKYKGKGLLAAGTTITSFVAIGELSGFGIYLFTTTALKTLSVVLGTTFSWAVYQSATSLLGIVLGPIGWIISGGMLAGGIIKAATEKNWKKLISFTIFCLAKKNELKLQRWTSRFLLRLQKWARRFLKRRT